MSNTFLPSFAKDNSNYRTEKQAARAVKKIYIQFKETSNSNFLFNLMVKFI